MSKKKKRKAREATLPKSKFMKPIDIKQFGSEDDPCFGKHYDLSDSICKRCGDSELCGVVYSQTTLKDKRKKVESKSRFKDMELDANSDLVQWVTEKKKEEMKRSEIIKKAKTMFGSSREEIKKIYKNL